MNRDAEEVWVHLCGGVVKNRGFKSTEGFESE